MHSSSPSGTQALFFFSYFCTSILEFAMPADFTDRLRPAKPTGTDTLAKERAGSSLPVDQLAQHLLDGDGSGFLQRQARVLQVLKGEKLFSKDQQQNLSRPDRFKLGLARAKLIKRLQIKLGWSEEDRAMLVSCCRTLLALLLK